MVLVWLAIDVLLLIGFLSAGVLVERSINRRADRAISRLNDCEDNRFTTWVRSLALGNPLLLAVILRCPTFLCYSIVGVLAFVILPFPLSAEFAVAYLLFLLFFYFIFWLSNVADKAKELRRKVLESTQTTGD